MPERFVPLQAPMDELGFPGGSSSGGGYAAALDQCEDIPAPGDLSNWSQNDYDLDLRLAVKLGFTVVSGSIGVSQRLLIREFARSAVCNGKDGRRYRYGTAVRLVVKTSSSSASSNLSMAFVAAETQMGKMQAESTLRVVGYVGNRLAGLLPPFRTFNVDTYAELSSTVNEVKKLIGEDTDNIRPTKLGIEIDPEETVDLDLSLGLIWGLTQIKRGRSCEEAKRTFPAPGSQSALEGIEEAYSSVPNSFGCTADRPTNVHKEAAREMLRGLELRD